MTEILRKVLTPSRRIDRGLLLLLAGVWLWKVVEVAGRESRLLRRNLGWGYLVDLTVPLTLTGLLGALFLFRRLGRH